MQHPKGYPQYSSTILSVASTASNPIHCAKSSVEVRLPPTINPEPKTFSSWVPPPSGWFYGNWKITYTTQPTYLPLLNMQWDSSPVFPQSDPFPGLYNDLASGQLANQSSIITDYGIDTPRRYSDPSLGPEWEAVYEYTGTGALAAINETWEVLAWGYDASGDGYIVIYETASADNNSAPPGLEIASRSENGPSAETVKAILHGLASLGDAGLTGLACSTQKIVVDGRRTGMPPVQCDAPCMNNTSTSFPQ